MSSTSQGENSVRFMLSRVMSCISRLNRPVSTSLWSRWFSIRRISAKCARGFTYSSRGWRRVPGYRYPGILLNWARTTPDRTHNLQIHRIVKGTGAGFRVSRLREQEDRLAVKRRLGALVAVGGPTSQRGAFRRDTGHDGAHNVANAGVSEAPDRWVGQFLWAFRPETARRNNA